MNVCMKACACMYVCMCVRVCMCVCMCVCVCLSVRLLSPAIRALRSIEGEDEREWQAGPGSAAAAGFGGAGDSSTTADYNNNKRGDFLSRGFTWGGPHVKRWRQPQQGGGAVVEAVSDAITMPGGVGTMTTTMAEGAGGAIATGGGVGAESAATATTAAAANDDSAAATNGTASPPPPELLDQLPTALEAYMCENVCVGDFVLYEPSDEEEQLGGGGGGGGSLSSSSPVVVGAAASGVASGVLASSSRRLPPKKRRLGVAGTRRYTKLDAQGQRQWLPGGASSSSRKLGLGVQSIVQSPVGLLKAGVEDRACYRNKFPIYVEDAGDVDVPFLMKLLQELSDNVQVGK
eukprot:GHVU01226493.1.p1 GENE.GHVU01226493.1~~GHVU01226493.1.p1  ORF type:complete len:347 (-),score=81.73 GHVU01226493.1:149-1189(-)